MICVRLKSVPAEPGILRFICKVLIVLKIFNCRGEGVGAPPRPLCGLAPECWLFTGHSCLLCPSHHPGPGGDAPRPRAALLTK